jgi:hypothetical protein
MHRAVIAHGAEDEHLALEAGDPSRREVQHRDHLASDERGRMRIGGRELRRADTLAELRTKVDPQPVARLSRLGKRVSGKDPADALVDPLDVVELDLRRTLAKA